MPGVPFTQVIEVAQAVAEELEAIGVAGSLKTSGSSGMHVYVPLAPDTPYEAGQLFCQIVATIVASKHPKIATVERTVGKRGRTVYVDYLQNIEGKTLASAYSARASEFAGVSTPLRLAGSGRRTSGPTTSRCAVSCHGSARWAISGPRLPTDRESTCTPRWKNSRAASVSMEHWRRARMRVERRPTLRESTRTLPAHRPPCRFLRCSGRR